MRFSEEAEQALDEYIEESTEARREEALIYYEGCTIVTLPIGAPPEYITVVVDGVNDPNVMWRGVPTTPAVGDEVLVWENPLSHRREIASASGLAGVTSKFSWCQTVVVAKCNGDFDDITDAIAYINALAAGPAANRYFALFVLGGNWVEAANVVIPDYVWVFGLGEATSIEMGAFDILPGNHTGLSNVRITLAASGEINVNAKTDVILDHVHAIQSSNDSVLWVHGASSEIECKDCHFETSGTEAAYIQDTSNVRFDNCKLEAHPGSGYALVLGGTAVVRMEWCELTAYCPVFTVAGTTFSHFSCQFNLATSTLAAGSHTALPTKRFNQTLIVAKAGGEFTSLSAAIAYINGQGDAAANKLYGVLMLDGNFAEAADVTVPAYVHVFGMGEGTEIELAAGFVLNLANNSYLAHVVVEGNTDAAEGVIQISGGTNVQLRNVKAIQANAAGYCYKISGYGAPRLYNCIAEGGAYPTGFYVDASDAYLFGCIGRLNLGTALAVTNDGDSFAFTWHCVFEGGTDDVTVGAAGSWYHDAATQFDPDNSTITGFEGPMPHGRSYFKGGVITRLVTDNVSDPPTDAELDAAFGQPATLGQGFIGIVDDNGAETKLWLCVTGASTWWYEELTLAV